MKRVSIDNSLATRFVYAFVGILSGGLLSLFVVVPICVLCWDATENLDQYWSIVAGPVIFALIIGLWGFISTDRMVDTLSDWWEQVIDSLTP